ncbi:hypothetical protein D3C78_1863560 [compost metagenome]
MIVQQGINLPRSTELPFARQQHSFPYLSAVFTGNALFAKQAWWQQWHFNREIETIEKGP